MERFCIYIIRVVWIIASIAILTSCSKLEQDFQYRPVNELTITTESNSYSIMQYDQLRIQPQIKESISGNNQYTYEWKVLDGTESTVLSNDKDLNVKITLTPKTSYKLQFTVKDTNTQISTLVLYDLVVNGIYYQGWLITHNLNNQATLSFIRTDNEVFHSPEHLANGKTYPGKALSTYFADFTFANTYSSILFFTTEGTYRFSQIDFSEMSETSDFFSQKDSNYNPAYGISVLGADQYIVDTDGLYVGFGYFDPNNVQVFQPFSDRLSGDYNLFPAAITSGYTVTYFYDNKYKRFLQVPYTGRELSVAVGSSAHSFNMSDVGKTMIAWDKGRTTISSERHYFIMEDGDGRYLYSLNGSTPGYAQQINYNACPDFARATSFATSGIFEQLYYAVGNKLYLYNMPGNSSELIYEFSNNISIKDIELQRNTSRKLVVGVDNGGAGEVYFFDINDLGKFTNNTYSAHFTGFGDIAHITYRK